jgi:hypothetical protein
MRQQAAQHLRRPRVLIINTKRQYHKFHAPFYRRMEGMANCRLIQPASLPGYRLSANHVELHCPLCHYWGCGELPGSKSGICTQLNVEANFFLPA